MTWIVALAYLAIIACAVRILLRPNREPSARVAWLAVLFALPLLGVMAYLLFGETSIGRKDKARFRKAVEGLPGTEEAPGWSDAIVTMPVTEPYAELFIVGQSSSGYPPVSGNSAELMKDSDTAIDRMIADIDAAERHVHLAFYIWLPDNNGKKMVEALKRACARGVTCRAMVDDLGSRDLIKSPYWKDMKKAGVQLLRALKIGSLLLRAIFGRIDLRNHRKILVIDNRVTYCGSQNCADPAFLPKAKYAPWVDAVMRFQGPVVRQNQHLFATDWMANGGQDLGDVLHEPSEPPGEGFPAQVIASGPTLRASTMPEMFTSLMYAAQRELVITTPYYVPDASIQAAICAAANRGVDVTFVMPARNDDFAVGATSRSYYLDMLTAGVKLYEYPLGLLHTKSMVVDGEVTLIGSANLDRRSFELNYENNILLRDPAASAAVRARQDAYIADSLPVQLSDVQAWSLHRRLWNNAISALSPVL